MASPLDPTGQLAEIVSPGPTMREDMVHVGLKKDQPDIRYRAAFERWEIPLKVRYNANGLYTLDDVVNIINLGGSTCGIGEWRNEKNGNYGMFHVEFDENAG